MGHCDESSSQNKQKSLMTPKGIYNETNRVIRDILHNVIITTQTSIQ